MPVADVDMRYLGVDLVHISRTLTVAFETWRFPPFNMLALFHPNPLETCLGWNACKAAVSSDRSGLCAGKDQVALVYVELGQIP